MKNYFGLALSDSMFKEDCVVTRKALTVEEAKEIIEGGVEVCLNPSHQATIKALKEKHDIEVAVPETPTRVSMSGGDSLLIFQVSGLPRLTDRHEYTEEEIASATFRFSIWTIVQERNPTVFISLSN